MKFESFARSMFAALLIVAGGIVPAAASVWKLDAAKSQLGFSGAQAGKAFKGHFTRFTAQIDFDPDHLETSHIVVAIDPSSAVTGDAQRDEALPGKDWFNAGQFSQAKFVTASIRTTGQGAYAANGTLTLRGVSKPVILPFKVEIVGNRAHAKGHLSLVRTQFGVGQGKWSNGQWVALDVGVDVDIVATR